MFSKRTRRLVVIPVAVAAMVAAVVLLYTAVKDDSRPAAVPVASPQPIDSLTVYLSDKGEMKAEQQEFVTDGVALPLNLVILNNGGGMFTDSPMWNKIVTIVCTQRVDKTSMMQLRSMPIRKMARDAYRGHAIQLLPLGTYELRIDGKATGLTIKVSSKSPLPTPSA